MARRSATRPPEADTTFGTYLRFLRRRVRLTQTELGIAVGYSDAQICRLEMGKRAPNLITLVALFFPALDVKTDSAEGQRLLELAAAEIPADTSAAPLPLASVTTPLAPAVVASLSAPLTSFVGRAHEMNTLLTLLRQGESRLITLLGSAGMGKTRLALQVAHHMQPHYADGVWFIDLSAVESAEFVPQAVAQGLGMVLENDHNPAEAVQTYLHDRTLLLVLDNMEQVRGAAALMATWLRAAAGLSLLITTRIALRLSAEHVFPLAPLALPDLANLPPPALLMQIESVALLIARLRAVTPDFTLTPANTLPIAAICVRVDGVPLALELVAAHGRLFTPQELLTEIAKQFVRLRRRGTDTPARHQSVNAALAWSYAQLSPAIQTLFSRLGMFASGWTLESALAVCDVEGEGRLALAEGLEILLDHSLIQRQVVNESTRFTMLAMVRAYAQAQLAAAAQESLYQRMVAHYVAQGAQEAHQLEVGGNQTQAVAYFITETDNFRALLTWVVAEKNKTAGLQLVEVLARFWYIRGQVSEGRQWAEAVLALPDREEPPLIVAYVLRMAGLMAFRQSDYRAAEAWYQQALTLYEASGFNEGKAEVFRGLGLLFYQRGDMPPAQHYFEAGLALYQLLQDDTGAARMMHNLGNIANQQNDFERAMAYYDQTQVIYRRIGDESGISLILLGVGAISRDLGNLAQATVELQESQAIALRLGDPWTAATAQLNLGDVAADEGNFAEARRLLEESFQSYEAIGDPQMMSTTKARIGGALLLEGDIAAATAYFQESLRMAHAIHLDGGIPEALEGLAGCMAHMQPLVAARLFGFAAARRVALTFAVAAADQPRLERSMAAAQGQLSAVQWAAALAEGATLSEAQAIRLALGEIGAVRTRG